MVVAKYQDKDVYTYAIPMSDTKPVIDCLLSGRQYKHRMFGIEALELSSKERGYPGIRVLDVYCDTPAYQHLQAGDVIHGVNGNQVVTLHDLVYEAFVSPRNAIMTLDVTREGKEKQVRLTL